MTLSSDLRKLSNSNGDQFHKFLQVFEQIIDILKEFKDNYEKKLNFTKLVKIFNIPDIYTNELISLLLGNQDIFQNVFQDYHLKKKKENNSVYLITEKKILVEIVFSTAQIKLLNDIIYTFKFIKRGKGFDIIRNGTKLLANLKSLKSEHPYLFESKENGLIYPSSLGLELGDLILSYNKGSKEIKELTIDNYTIVVRDDE
ncbi:MAG: hypothetical protein HWN81_02860 [Candidatus Lokiarchaeota archaeon]|nr:hypothetical protein [Candidatus Lokiarchaeota archaeon]